MRLAIARLLAIGLACVLAQTPNVFADLADLDKGHRILLERGLQIHAMAVDQPEIPNWSVYDAGGWNGVDFQFNYFAPQALSWAGAGQPCLAGDVRRLQPHELQLNRECLMRLTA